MQEDKPKVPDEVWDDDRIKSYLLKIAPNQSRIPFPGDADYHVLRHAYQSMRPDDFRRFLDFFVADGRDARARDVLGRTLAEAIAGHPGAAPFIEALNAH